MKKQHLYHVSMRRLDTLNVGRRFPIYSKREPKTPRLCVCPAVPNCFAAATFLAGQDVYVYRTQKPTRGITPRGVWDSTITGERWLIPPLKLNHVATVKARDVDRLYAAIRWFHKDTRQNSNVRLRIAQMKIAWEILGVRFPHRSEQSWCDRIAKEFEILDGETYILNQIEAHNQ